MTLKHEKGALFILYVLSDLFFLVIINLFGLPFHTYMPFILFPMFAFFFFLINHEVFWQINPSPTAAVV